MAMQSDRTRMTGQATSFVMKVRSRLRTPAWYICMGWKDADTLLQLYTDKLYTDKLYRYTTVTVSFQNKSSE